MKSAGQRTANRLARVAFMAFLEWHPMLVLERGTSNGLRMCLRWMRLAGCGGSFKQVRDKPESETGDQTRALKCSLSARAILGDHHAFTTCVHTCVYFNMCK